MDQEGIMLSEISQRKTQILYGFSHMWNLKTKKPQANKQTKDKQTNKIRANKTETDS